MKLLSLLILTICLLSGRSSSEQRLAPIANPTTVFSPKEQAYSILQSKCNGCHANRNKRMVFTLGNMDGLSEKINQQVFIKKRMPRGNQIELSEHEKYKLKTWIESLN